MTPPDTRVYVINWHTSGFDCTIDRLWTAPSGTQAFATFEAAKRHAIGELRAQADELRDRARKITAAANELENRKETWP